jgi:hypothetical protein
MGKSGLWLHTVIGARKKFMAQEEKTRSWSMIAIIAFNITIILCMSGYILRRGGTGGLYFMDFVVAIVLATFVACGAFLAAMKLDK